MMVRLNTRHELPQISIRQTQGRLDESAIVQPRTRSAGNRQASANKGATQPSLSIDSYPSRRAYGFRKHGDLAAERGQRGISDAQAATGRHAQKAWSKATTAARRGDDVVQEIKSEIFSDYQARVVFTTADIPDPQMQGYQSEVVGEPDVGDVTVDIETEPNARIHYTPGSVETSLENEGFIRHWVSMDRYDIYA
ncbi:MAG: hypothetical protein IKO74_04090 [Selenomonadaceae bacterium]|nr:hypothetical protein [Selenomonadaceae bacterium]